MTPMAPVREDTVTPMAPPRDGQGHHLVLDLADDDRHRVQLHRPNHTLMATLIVAPCCLSRMCFRQPGIQRASGEASVQQTPPVDNWPTGRS